MSRGKIVNLRGCLLLLEHSRLSAFLPIWNPWKSCFSLMEPCGKSAKIKFDLGKSAQFEFGLPLAWSAIWIYAARCAKIFLFAARCAKICINFRCDRHNWIFFAILIRLIATFEFSWLPFPESGLGAIGIDPACVLLIFLTADGQPFFLEILTPGRCTGEPVWLTYPNLSGVTATIEFLLQFWFGWLPPLNSADCHFLNPAWAPLVLIRLVCCLFFSWLMANHFSWKS